MRIKDILVENETDQDQNQNSSDNSTANVANQQGKLKPENGNYSVNPEVKKIQKFLSNLGYNLGPPGVDGKFGPYTASAVKSFKNDYNLPGGPVIGQKERSVMNKILAGSIKKVTPTTTSNTPGSPPTDRANYTGSFKWAPGVDKRVKDDVLSKLKQVQSNFDLPLTITSGYRSPKRNAKAGGASKSSHMTGEAVDVKFDGDQESTNRFIQIASQAGFGGIGVYRPGSVHLDIRNKRAWGPSFRFSSLPRWASVTIRQHLS